MAITEQQVQAALKELTDPNTGKDYVTGKEAKNIKIDGDLLHRLAGDEVAVGVRVDQRLEARLDVGFGEGHRSIILADPLESTA